MQGEICFKKLAVGIMKMLIHKMLVANLKKIVIYNVRMGKSNILYYCIIYCYFKISMYN